ncbi:protein male-specific lethal-3 [Ischnura elegans]|uniref:protein male-specific lethal-3 n=1 Tax=Ischnura elegans TaxID=197161 RepID=UPI001ED89E14|nr:protein male-specific lethal-3 [Ischnura elegans]
MVSTRGVKFKFSEGEKVLCYEPDPTKAKVLYDSKVLEVIVNKDSRGRKCVEYLIHFQGWNSSWDRCVGEDYVLKDTDDNRRLQRTLSDKAQLQLCSNSYLPACNSRRERKQQARRRKTSDRTSDGEGGVGGGGGTVKRQRRREDEGGGEGFSSEEENSDGGEDGEDEDAAGEDEDGDEEGEPSEGRIPLSLSDNLKKLLEDDGDLITCKHKLVRLPASPNVIAILEGFMKQYALNQLFPATISPEKRKKQPRNQHHHHANGHGSRRPRDYEKALRSLNLCKEVVDGIRIYFDHTLSGLLLYAQEKEQYEEEVASLASLSNSCRSEGRSSNSKYTPTKFAVKQEQNNSYDTPGRLTIEDFLSVQVKEEPRISCGDSDKELSDLKHDISVKSPLKEERHGEEKGVKHLEKSKDSFHDLKDDSSKFPRLESTGESRVEGANQSLSGTFHNAMSSAASTSSSYSTPSCVTPSNRVSSVAHDRSSINSMGMTASENALLRKIMNWRMVPEGAGVANTPSQLYGAPHLARLFVKLPDLLHASGMHEKKLKILLGYLHSFLEYLEEHTDWFGEPHYKENPSLRT